MENFIGKVIKIVSGDKGGSKDYWVEDNKSKACYECEAAFSQWNRRHHCRICGRVFCGNCTRNSIPPPRESPDQQWLRVCNFCYRVRQRTDQPAVRVQPQHAASRGVGSAMAGSSGNTRQLTDPIISLSGPSSGDGSSSALAAARIRNGGIRGARTYSSVFRVTEGDLSWAVPPPLEDDFGMSLTDRDARLLYLQQREAGSQPPDAPPQANSLAEVHRHVLWGVAECHLRGVVQQLLMAEGLPQPEVWAPIVAAAAQAVAAYLSPLLMYANGQHDPRQAVKMKKVADVGRPEDTCVVTGVVVRKGLVHRKMRSYIEYPKVLLLAGSLEYQRETNKLSSFDLMDQDKQYLANAVARIAVMKPDVVLVEGSVARMAQEDLLARNISVAQKIKSKVLERLARCMGVRVAPTVEHLNPASAHLYLGDCKVFRVESETVILPQTESQTAVAHSDPSVCPQSAAGTGTAAGDTVPAATAPTTASATAANQEAGASAPCPTASEAHQQPSASNVEAQGTAPPSQQPQQSSSAVAVATSPPAPTGRSRLLCDPHPGSYTSLSAAMMMKALGSGPNAAAAVAAVSAGSAVAAAATPQPPWHQHQQQAGPTTGTGPPGDGQSGRAGAPGTGGAGSGMASGAAAGSPGVTGDTGAAPSGPTATPPVYGLGRGGPGALPAGPPPPPQVTLLYFEGCRPTTATVLLKGGGGELLRKLKTVLGFAVLTAWNQRLEVAFLTDMLTAAVAAAGEEAYVSSLVPSGGSSSISLSPALSTRSSLPAIPQPSLAPSLSLSLPPLPSQPPLSLALFRSHAEQAVRTSVAAACVAGAPGILLSLSPHCNAWDDSLIAEWEQQGFTFPHSLQPYRGLLGLPPEVGNLQLAQVPGPTATATVAPAAVSCSAATAPTTASLESSNLPQRQPSATAVSIPATGGPSSTMRAESSELAVVARVVEDSATMGGLVNGSDGVSKAYPHSARAPASIGGASASDAAEGVSGDVPDGAGGCLMPGNDCGNDAALTPPVAVTETQDSEATADVEACGEGGGLHPAGTPEKLTGAGDRMAGLTTSLMLSSPFAAVALQGAEPVGMQAPTTTNAATTGEPHVGRSGTVDLMPGAVAAAAAAVTEQREGQEEEGVLGEPTVSEVESLSGGVSAMAPVSTGAGGAAESAAAAAGNGAAGPHPPPPPGSSPCSQEVLVPGVQSVLQRNAVMVLQGQRIYNHQRIFVTCMFRRSRDRHLCDPFQVKQIDYYHRSSDVPLIKYIRMCTQAGWACPGTGCPDPFTAHESVFFFGGRKLTIFYATLPPMHALPGEEKNLIWHWTRPIGRGRDAAGSCRRVPLSQDACHLSMGRFLELSFSADGLDVFGRSLHYDHVRYFGLGRTLVCMFPERTNVYVMQLPDVVMSYSTLAQAKWLRQEGEELASEARSAFELVELLLRDSPHYGGAEAAVEVAGGGGGGGPWSGSSAYPQSLAQEVAGGGGGELAGGSTCFTPGTSPVGSMVASALGVVAGGVGGGGYWGGAAGAGGGAGAGSAAASGAALLARTLAALKADWESFQALLEDCLARNAPQGEAAAPAQAAAPPTPPAVMGGGMPAGVSSTMTTASNTPATSGGGGGGGGGGSSLLGASGAAGYVGAYVCVHWDEHFIVGVRELNRLRAVLSKAVLLWASRLQDPAGLMAHYSRVTSGVGPGAAAGRTHRATASSSSLPQAPQQQQQQQQQPSPAPQAITSSSPHNLTAPPTPTAAAAASCAPGSAPAPEDAPVGPQVILSRQDTTSLSLEGSISLFSSATPAAAAQRLGLVSATTTTTITSSATTTATASGAAAASMGAIASAAFPSDGTTSLLQAAAPDIAVAGGGYMAMAGVVPASQAAVSTALPVAVVSESANGAGAGAGAGAAEQSAGTTAHALPIPIVPQSNGPLFVHVVAEMVALQQLRGGGAELLEGSRALLLGAASGGAVATGPTAGQGSGAPAAAVTSTAPTTTSLGRVADVAARSGSFRRELPVAAVSSGGAEAAATGPSSVHVTAPAASVGSQGAGGAITAGEARVGISAAVPVPAPGPGPVAGHGSRRLSGPGGAGPLGVSGGGAPSGVRGSSSLPRSASVSSNGDLADIPYMGGMGADSGPEDNDDEEGEVDEEEEPDHDTFLAFTRPAGSRGTSTAAGASSAGGAADRTIGDSGDDEPGVADGACYYRALFGDGAGTAGAAGIEQQLAPSNGIQHHLHLQQESETAALGSHQGPVLVPAPHASQPHHYRSRSEPTQPPLVHNHHHNHHINHHNQHQQLVHGGQTAAAVPQSSACTPITTAPGGATVPHFPGAPTSALRPSGGVPAPSGLTAAINMATASNLVTGATGTAGPLGIPSLASHPSSSLPNLLSTLESASGTDLAGSSLMALPGNSLTLLDAASIGAASAGAGSRRQLLVNVRRRLENAAAVTLGASLGASLARGFIPLPGRAMMPPGVNDTFFTIFDNEPTSIIAYALSTRGYHQQINAGYKAIFGKARTDSARERSEAAAGLEQQLPQPPEPQQGSTADCPPGTVASAPPPVTTSGHSAATLSSTTATSAPSATSITSSSSPHLHDSFPLAPGTQPHIHQPTGHTMPVPPPAPPPVPNPPPVGVSGGPAASSPDADWWTVLTSREACHVRVTFEDEARSMPWTRAKFSVTAHFAPQFAELRRRCIQGGEAAFLASMSRCKRWESRGGKSNAYFAKTRDDRYIVKSLSKSEKASFMNFAPHYFSHMGRHLLTRDAPTCLAKILGVYSVTFKPQPTSAGLEGAGSGGSGGTAAGAALIKELKEREFSQDLLVMENCFYDRPVARIYDLKGSERNRFNADAASRPEDRLEVHLDDNLRRTMHTNPIFVDARSRAAMEAAVWADTAFLAGQDVMDYSLLVGVDKENGVLALAIIDFIRQYTWDKQLETWVKSSGMLGGNGKEPTIISPKQYMRRFRAAMQQYFTAVPGSAGSEVPRDPDAVL